MKYIQSGFLISDVYYTGFKPILVKPSTESAKF